MEVCPGFGSEFAQSNNIHPMDEFDGECVFDCPQNYTGDNGTCLSCDHTNIKCSKCNYILFHTYVIIRSSYLLSCICVRL